MSPPERINTPSLLLRRVVLDDAQAMFSAYAQDADVARYMAWRLTGDYEDSLSYVKKALDWWENPEVADDFAYAIVLRDSHEFVGCCSVGPHSAAEKFHWGIGYTLAKRFWGRGYGTEAVSAVGRMAISIPEVLRVSAVVDVENVGSARVLEKSGFVREGILRRYAIHPNCSNEPRDIFMYAMTK
jgi:ribosomal-protein-alanine N-acetyltransferase